MSSSVDDVAAALLRAVGPMTAMKLQKLTYYVQVWHLVRHGAPAFHEPVEAWRDGPVVPHLFDQHRNRRLVRDWAAGRADELLGTVRDVLADVVDRYGDLTAEQLSQITHREAPWREARRGVPDGARSAAIIPQDAMASFHLHQGGLPSTAVEDAVASARLEGGEAGPGTLRLLRRVAEGDMLADEAVRRVLHGGG